MAATNNTIQFNKTQASFLLTDATEMYVYAGRGTGKTTMLAPYESRNMHSMPRCSRMLLAPTFRKMMTDLLPPLVKQWELMGYKRDLHFVVGKSDIPKKCGWPDPYIAPERSARDFIVHWYTGACLRITSMDRKVTNNGTECDGITADELKLIPEDQFNETIKTNRGNLRYFSHLPEHHSIVGFTDKYFTKKGSDWVLKKRELSDPAKVKQIITLQLELNELLQAQASPALIKRIEKLLFKLRTSTVAVFEGSSLENIQNLGVDYFWRMKRNMSPNEFKASILNYDIVKIEGGFYPQLDEAKHGYYAERYEKFDNAEYNFKKIENRDCEWDADHSPSKPLEISVDWGGSINTMVVCQSYPDIFKVINQFYTLPTETYGHLAQKFLQYYSKRADKTLHLYYDPSGNNARADSNETYAQEFTRLLREGGWKVIVNDTIRTNPHYHDKHLLWQTILSENDPHYPKFRMNRANCEDVFTSMLKAPLKQGRGGFEKDKSSERRNIPQQEATHFSDAVDLIVYAKYFDTLASFHKWSGDAIR